MSITRRDSTLGEVLLRAKDQVVQTQLGTSANVHISLEEPTNNPAPLGGSGPVWVVYPGEQWRAAYGDVLGEVPEIIFEGDLNLVCWLNTGHSAIYTDQQVLTDPLVGADSIIQRAIKKFDADNVETANLCDSNGVSPLMESLTFKSVTMPKKTPGVPWRGFVLTFTAVYRLQTTG